MLKRKIYAGFFKRSLGSMLSRQALSVLLIVPMLLALMAASISMQLTHAQGTQYRLVLMWVSEDQGKSVWGLDWSPDGKYVVIGTEDGWLKVYDASSGKYLWGLKLGRFAVLADWSPDGKYIAVTTSNLSANMVFVIDAGTHKVVWSKKMSESVCGVAWDPSGEYLAVGTIYYLYLFKRDGEQLWRSEKQPSGDIYNIAWSHSGDKVAINGGMCGCDVIVYSKDGKELWHYNRTHGCIVTLDWSPDDKYLAAGSHDGHVYVFNENGKLLWRSRYLEKFVDNVAWDPSGEYLAVSGQFGTALYTKDGKQVWMNRSILTTESTGNHGNLRWSEHGYMVVGGKRLYIIDKEGNILAESKDLGDWTLNTAWSPDKTKIATVGKYRKLYVWRIETAPATTTSTTSSTTPTTSTSTTSTTTTSTTTIKSTTSTTSSTAKTTTTMSTSTTSPTTTDTTPPSTTPTASKPATATTSTTKQQTTSTPTHTTKTSTTATQTTQTTTQTKTQSSTTNTAKTTTTPTTQQQSIPITYIAGAAIAAIAIAAIALIAKRH